MKLFLLVTLICSVEVEFLLKYYVTRFVVDCADREWSNLLVFPTCVCWSVYLPVRCMAGWFRSFQHPGHRARCAQQANESILNEEVQVDSYIIPGLLSSEWICTAMTNGHALENVGGLPFFNHAKELTLNLINLCN